MKRDIWFDYNDLLPTLHARIQGREIVLKVWNDWQEAHDEFPNVPILINEEDTLIAFDD